MLSFAFQSGYDEAIDGIKIDLFYIVENVLSEISHRCTLEEEFERGIEKWTKISIYRPLQNSRPKIVSFCRPSREFYTHKDREGI